MESYDSVLQKAMDEAKRRHPTASPQRLAAAANSIAYLVTGWCGGFGGPSVREHAVSRLWGGKQCSFEDACERVLDADGPVFGPLTPLHREVWRNEYCFDDDPEDREALGGSSE